MSALSNAGSCRARLVGSGRRPTRGDPQRSRWAVVRAESRSAASRRQGASASAQRQADRWTGTFPSVEAASSGGARPPRALLDVLGVLMPSASPTALGQSSGARRTRHRAVAELGTAARAQHQSGRRAPPSPSLAAELCSDAAPALEAAGGAITAHLQQQSTPTSASRLADAGAFALPHQTPPPRRVRRVCRAAGSLRGVAPCAAPAPAPEQGLRRSPRVTFRFAAKTVAAAAALQTAPTRANWPAPPAGMRLAGPHRGRSHDRHLSTPGRVAPSSPIVHGCAYVTVRPGIAVTRDGDGLGGCQGGVGHSSESQSALPTGMRRGDARGNRHENTGSPCPAACRAVLVRDAAAGACRCSSWASQSRPGGSLIVR
jgi:hypothetical protein